jgi:hypothetical protein
MPSLKYLYYQLLSSSECPQFGSALIDDEPPAFDEQIREILTTIRAVVEREM